MICIYQLKCTKTGYKYIGSTKCFSVRKSIHKSDLKKGMHHSKKMQKQFDKYGWENFEICIIEKCKEHKRDERENYWINQVSKNKSFNTAYAGESPANAYFRKHGKYTNTGKKMSDETKQKISIANKGKKRSLESRKKMSDSHIGQTSWNKGTKGVMKPNSGSFGNGRTAPLKGRKKVIINGKVRYVFP